MRIAPQAFVQTVVSPNGMTVALSTENGKDSAIWLYDLAGASTARRLTIGGPARFPVWSPDGTRVAYQLESDTGSAVFIQRADGSDTPVQLTAPASGVAHIPQSWSIDGDHLLFDERSPQRFTLNVWSMKERQATAIPGVESTLHTGATFSPDGRWIAFAIRRPNTRTTVFVQPYPPTGAVYQISPSNTEDGHHPVWSRDGAALLYNPGPGRSIKMVQVRTTPTFVLGAVSDLTVAFLNASPSVPRPFDLLPDGRVAGLQAPAGSPLAEAAPQMVMVLNWFEELKQRVPAAR
jgi:Tol biopolymer transport system component